MENEDDFLQEMKQKMEEYFKNNNLLEKEDLDNFLKAIDLYEVWNTDEEKEVCWQCLNKYNKKGKIDLKAALNGIRDLMNQDEEESHENILTHLSRRASVRDPQGNKASNEKLKRIAFEEYECVDNDTLFQLKKIFSLLKITKDNNRIKFNNIQDICTKNKFIKITPEEIWKYLSFLTFDNNEGKTYRPILINYTVFTEIENFINEKIPNDEMEEKIMEETENNEIEEDSDEDEPLDIIEKINNTSETIQGETMAFTEILKSLQTLSDDMVEKAQNILNWNDNNLEEVLFVKDLMLNKINDLNKHNKIVEKKQKSINNKMEKIKFYINKLKTDFQNLEDDYKALNNKYETHQKNVNKNDEEVERLFGENLMLIQDKESKEKEIEKLNEEKKELENKNNNLFSQLENSLKKNKDMQTEIKGVTRNSLKYKANYESVLEKIVKLEKLYKEELLKKEQQEKKAKEEEDAQKDEDVLAAFNSKKKVQDPIADFMSNRRRSQIIEKSNLISLQNENETNLDKLIKYVKEMEKMNEILTERNQDSTMKVKELENVINKNRNLANQIIKRVDSRKLVKLNEILKPSSSYEIYNEKKMSIIGQSNNYNPKKNKIVKKYSFAMGNTNVKKNNKKPEIILSKSNFSINILKSMKNLIIFEIEKVEKFTIEKKISIEEKRNELVDESKKINLLFKDDSNTMNTNKTFKINQFKDLDSDTGSFSTKDLRSNTIMINPKDLLIESRDYFGLYQEDYVRRKLGHLNDLCTEKNIYTDKIYVLIEKKQLAQKYLMLTPINFCIIEQHTLKFVYVDKIKNIKNIVISNKNLNMILFRFADGEDLIIESIRPYDLISYLKDTYYPNNDSIFRYEDKFIIKIKGQLHSLLVNDKILTNLLNFDGAIKVGYLSLYKAKFISSNFSDVIGVLLNIGLLLVEESNLRPIAIIPILDSIIKKVEKERFGNNNCFEIYLPSGVTKVFSVRKPRERESWLIEFSKMKKDHDDKMKRFGAFQKKMSTKKVLELK